MEVDGQRHATAALPRRRGPDIYCRGTLGMQTHEMRKIKVPTRRLFHIIIGYYSIRRCFNQ